MSTSASFLHRQESIVKLLTPSQQTMDDDSLSSHVSPNPVDLMKLYGIFILLSLVVDDYAGILSPVFRVVWALDFSLGLPHLIELVLLVKYGLIPSIASRLRAVNRIHVREMDNLSALMAQWESRSCQKVDNYRNNEDTMTRLRSFLNEMESLDLTDKLYELKDLSSHLNIVTKGLIRSPLFKPLDLITTWRLFVVYYLDRVLVSEG